MRALPPGSRAQLLDLSQNQLTGTLPSAWQQLALLRRLDVSSNALSSTIPAAWPGGMGALSRLIITNNTQVWPPCLSALALTSLLAVRRCPKCPSECAPASVPKTRAPVHKCTRADVRRHPRGLVKRGVQVSVLHDDLPQPAATTKPFTTSAVATSTKP